MRSALLFGGDNDHFFGWVLVCEVSSSSKTAIEVRNALDAAQTFSDIDLFLV